MLRSSPGPIRVRRVGATCIMLLLMAPAASAADLDAVAVLGRLQAWLDGTRDLEAEFVQKLTSGALGAGLEESGRIYLLRPGRMRWDYLEPEVKVALIDGDRTRMYIEEDRQMWEGALDASGSLLPSLLSSRRPISETFESALETTPARGGEGAYRLRLVPREAEDDLRQVVLTLRPSDFAIVGAVVIDGAGSRMAYDFSDLRRNRGLSESVFHFEPPSGTEIVVLR